MLRDHELSWLQYYLWSLVVCIWKGNVKTQFWIQDRLSQIYVREYNDRESSSHCDFFFPSSAKGRFNLPPLPLPSQPIDLY